jgi:hypothetical protein
MEHHIFIRHYIVEQALSDRSQYVSYGGRADEWYPFDGLSAAAWETISRTYSNGGKSNATFQGSTISLLYSLDPGRGTANVYIDDVYRETINAYAPQTRRQVIRTWTVPYGIHRIEIRAQGGGNFDVDAFAVDIATVGPGYYENNNSHFRYHASGAWEHLTGITGTSGGTISRTSNRGHIARFTFSGSYVTYKFSKGPDRGKAAITIDGIQVDVIDMYASTYIRQQYVTYFVGSNSPHVFHITNVSDPAALNYVIDIDSIQIQ